MTSGWLVLFCDGLVRIVQPRYVGYTVPMRSISDQGADFNDDAPPDVWLRVKTGNRSLDLQTLFGAFTVPFASMVRWGGLACMVGGGLWLAVIFLIQLWSSLFYLVLFYRFPDVPIVLDTRLFVAPLL